MPSTTKSISMTATSCLLLLAGCAQMPNSMNTGNLAYENHQEVTKLLKKQNQLDLATMAVANKLDATQKVINQRLAANEPLIPSDRMLREKHSVTVTLPGAACKTVTVQPGQTLSEIAAQNNVTVTQLKMWNAISNPNLISAGQKIRIDVCHEK